MPDALERVARLVRAIPDFPKPGIMFRDITPMVRDPAALDACIEHLAAPFRDQRVSAVAGMEARGFIFGALVAARLGVGFVPLRKPGKLPYDVQSVSYDLEYGSAALEAHIDAVLPGERILLVDDLLATGGTCKASCELVERLGGEVLACAFVIELDALGGRAKLGDRPVHALLHY
ncbi:MAG: adenine phosphoribosyltransferase [Planctomycetes bacterium]|nr:adenine phosphoribosyltransferase [Planctomycetota bacterium]